MVLDDLFGNADEQPATENGRISEKRFARNEKLEADNHYKQDQGNNKGASAPTAQHNLSPNAYTQRSDQLDWFENLPLGGSETSPPGATAAGHRAVTARCPGLKKGGSDVLGNETPVHDQGVGAPAPGTAAPDAGRATDWGPGRGPQLPGFGPAALLT